MTRNASARLAGASYLLYIAVAFPSMVLSDAATAGATNAAKLASIATHLGTMRLTAVLGLLTAFTAFALAVGLYGITRDEDHELAVFALVCRVGEGVLNAASPLTTVGLIWLATRAASGAVPSDAAETIAGYLLETSRWGPAVGGTLFAVGSTIFSYLLLRGRIIPAPLAWLGVVASVLLVVVLPLELGGVVRGLVVQLSWLPMAAFELTLGPWLLIKGAAPPAAAR
jgi:uncharacterized protein DUF4386